MLNITFGGAPLTVNGNQLQVGDKAPEFSVVTKDLTPWNLSDSNNIKIISVIPSLDTGVCQLQTKRFNKEIEQMNGVDIITISMDLPFAQGRWCAAEGIEKLIIVSDYQNRDFASKYSLLIEELKLLSRAVFVLDKDNIIKYVEYLKEITDEPNYENAIKVVKELI